ncbi:MAG: HU family DNA-binding protein [Terriglobales bacterium]
MEQAIDAGLKMLSADDLKPNTPCPDSETFALYVQGEVDDETRRTINQHIAFCKECYREYLALAEPDYVVTEVERELRRSPVVHNVGSSRLTGQTVDDSAGERIMTKAQLVRHLAQEVNAQCLSHNYKLAAAFLEILTTTAIKETREKGVFVLPGLGLMKKVRTKAWIGRNAQTGQPIRISAKNSVKFYLMKAVKDAIADQKKK